MAGLLTEPHAADRRSPRLGLSRDARETCGRRSGGVGRPAPDNVGRPAPNGGPLRAGFTLFELTIAAILLAAVLLTAVPTLAWIVRVRQGAERHQAAVLGVGNLMERLTALSWDELTTERAAEFGLPESLARQLPEWRLKVSVSVSPDDPNSKQVFIELQWQEVAAGRQSPSVRLTAWVYRHELQRGMS